MNNLSPASTSYLLEVSIEDLHSESLSWLSEIDFWKLELSFYQKLLEKISVNLSSVDEKKSLDHFQNLIIYFLGELLGKYAHDIREHEKHLSDMIRKKSPFNEQLYREVHKMHKSRIASFVQDFKEYRQSLYAFAEKHL